jgi:C-5 cytosine-specific DNA methylase
MSWIGHGRFAYNLLYEPELLQREAMMDQTRYLDVTPGNLSNSTLYVNAHFDFFPKSAFGGPKRNGNSHGGIELLLDGLGETVTTDIGQDAKTGKPRKFFRDRSWVRRFYEFHKIKAGQKLALEKIAPGKYRLSTCPRQRLRAAEFFAGIGLVRLALERQGWEVVFANDIDEDKAEMYRDNWPDDPALHVGDIHDLDPAEIPTCDLFTASFPCNDLSIAGKWDGLDGKQSSAFWGFIDILRKLEKRRPPLVLLENVMGFTAS